jgi:RimJ/RimL family protein N-acetyltransferase
MVSNYPLDYDDIYDKFKKSPHSAAQGHNYSYSITLKKSSTLAGMCGLFDINKEQKKGELGYWITPESRRQGIAFAACSLLMESAFTWLDLHKVWAETFATNIPSQKLLEKLGFRKIGILEKDVYKHGRWADRIQYEIVHPEQ